MFIFLHFIVVFSHVFFYFNNFIITSQFVSTKGGLNTLIIVFQSISKSDNGGTINIHTYPYKIENEIKITRYIFNIYSRQVKTLKPTPGSQVSVAVPYSSGPTWLDGPGLPGPSSQVGCLDWSRCLERNSVNSRNAKRFRLFYLLIYIIRLVVPLTDEHKSSKTIGIFKFSNRYS